MVGATWVFGFGGSRRSGRGGGWDGMGVYFSYLCVCITSFLCAWPNWNRGKRDGKGGKAEKGEKGERERGAPRYVHSFALKQNNVSSQIFFPQPSPLVSPLSPLAPPPLLPTQDLRQKNPPTPRKSFCIHTYPPHFRPPNELPHKVSHFLREKKRGICSPVRHLGTRFAGSHEVCFRVAARFGGGAAGHCWGTVFCQRERGIVSFALGWRGRVGKGVWE